MGKKRPFRLDNKAQITLFMIIGVLLFFAFLFTLYLASSLQLSQLSSEQEKILAKAFKKESFRLFVDDCLQDELEQGLILLGKQGMLWADQPGGTKQFSAGINGITPGDERILYAITDEYYPAFPQAYPCDGEEGAPLFCNYRYPDTAAGFGITKLFPSTFTQDLKQYLIDRTAWCVQQFIFTNISQHAEIVPTEMQLDLTIHDEGVSVKVNYPLRFKVGREEIFQLSTFDFFYPSHFKQLLDTVASPLTWEQKFVDFNYTLETFTRPTFAYASEQNVGPCVFDEEANYFLCERSLPLDIYQSLGLAMTKESLPGGDDIFTFTPALYEITANPEPYSLRIARQNRPPALDYIQRAACPAEGYDYLIIKEDEMYGDINLVPQAIDPDEDDFSFSLSSELGEQQGDLVHRSVEEVANFPSGRYTVTAAASDGYKVDSQEVRVLVDRPIAVGLELEFPPSYGIESRIGGGGDTVPLYVVSREDPILLQATIPAETETSNLQTIALTYFDGASVTNIGRLDYDNPHISTAQCYNLPFQREGDPPTCLRNVPYDLDSYYNTEDKINRITADNYYAFHPFQRATSTDPGTLSLNFNTQYCGVPIDEQQSVVKVLVKECVPVRNPEHPFAYPYQDYTFDGEGNFVGNNPGSVNPFSATHSCCIGDPTQPGGWRIKTAEEGDCFTHPLPGCYGKILGLSTGSNRGYILEEEFAVCDGTRGNVCGSRKGRLYQEKLRCGTPLENPDCRSNIPAACRGELSFGFTENDLGVKGWCSGRMGCADFCSTAIVYTGPEEERTYFSSADINEIARENQITSALEMAGFGFKCGCSGVADGTKCDADFDGRFDGVCDGGQCHDVICIPGQVRCELDTIGNIQQCNDQGTRWEAAGTCGERQYCSEGECKPQTCTPKALVCYPEFISWVGRYFAERVESIEDAVAENSVIEKYPFVCAEDGSEYNVIRAECSSCSDTVTVVEVNAGEGEDEEGEEWRCGGCTADDEHLDRRCLKGGGEGVCQRRTSGSNQITYECLPS